jgi:hypothetical protein
MWLLIAEALLAGVALVAIVMWTMNTRRRNDAAPPPADDKKPPP